MGTVTRQKSIHSGLTPTELKTSRDDETLHVAILPIAIDIARPAPIMEHTAWRANGSRVDGAWRIGGRRDVGEGK